MSGRNPAALRRLAALARLAEMARLADLSDKRRALDAAVAEAERRREALRAEAAAPADAPEAVGLLLADRWRAAEGARLKTAVLAAECAEADAEAGADPDAARAHADAKLRINARIGPPSRLTRFV